MVFGFLPCLLSPSSTLPCPIQCSPLHLEDAAESWVIGHMRARCSGLSLAPFLPSCLPAFHSAASSDRKEAQPARGYHF